MTHYTTGLPSFGEEYRFNYAPCLLKEGDRANDNQYDNLVLRSDAIWFGEHIAKLYSVLPSSTYELRKLLLEMTSSRNESSPVLQVNQEQKNGPIFKEWFEVINEIQERLIPGLPLVNDFYYFRDFEKPYHIDRIPSPGSYTTVLTLSKDIHHGYIVCPEYRAAVNVDDNTLFIFNGRQILHGVTPFITNNFKGSYRISVVFFHTKSK